MENSSSSASISDRREWPSTWSGDEIRRPKAGGRSSATTLTGSLRWICSSSRAIRQAEVGPAKTMIERTEERFGLKPERLAADTAYGAAPMLNWLVEEKGIAPHIPVNDKSKRDDGTFSRGDFRYDPASDVYYCPGGKQLSTSGTVHNDNTLLYRASRRDCGICPLKPNCCPKEPSRKIPRDIHERARDVARSFVGTEGFEQSRRERKKRRCGLHTSNASLGSTGFDSAAREAPRMSLFLPPSLRTCDRSPNWSPGHRHIRFSASRSVRVA
jgi:hypothetical protein